MLDDFNIVLAQINPIVGDVAGNAKIIENIWQENESSDLIVFPELCLSGYPPEDLVLKPSFIEACAAQIKSLVTLSKNHEAAILIGAPITQKAKLYNAALLIHGGKVQASILKHHLPNYGVFDEQRVFEAGPLPAPVDFKGRKLGVMICEDMWFADVAKNLKKQKTEILIVPNGSPFESDKREIRLEHARARVSETGLPLVYVNQVGGQDELVFDGGSFVMDGKGNIINQLPFFQSCHREGFTLKDIKEAPEAPSAQALRDDNEMIYQALKLGLHDYIVKNNFPGILLGLSGGIDSALTAVLAVDALGADKVQAIMLPSRYTSQESLDDAQELAENLGVEFYTIPITDSVKALNEAVSDFASESSSPVTFENIQSRSRGLILMALSNASGKMVLSTGNKSEMAVGYATLYGDMNGGFNALKDVYKTQVYELSRWRNEQGAVIPENIITKAPTAELKPDQTDQDNLPPYEDLDAILRASIEEEKSVEEIVALGFDKDIVTKTMRMLTRAEYKRRQACPGVKITSRAFGRERRYPITNGFKV